MLNHLVVISFETIKRKSFGEDLFYAMMNIVQDIGSLGEWGQVKIRA